MKSEKDKHEILRDLGDKAILIARMVMRILIASQKNVWRSRESLDNSKKKKKKTTKNQKNKQLNEYWILHLNESLRVGIWWTG